MSINPEHLFDQADALIDRQDAGSPRQADLRRALSATYYALFHAALGTMADWFAGANNRNETYYALVYRKIDHRMFRELCEEIVGNPSKRYAPYFPQNGFGADISSFATAVIELQNKRFSADYDPLFRVKKADAKWPC